MSRPWLDANEQARAVALADAVAARSGVAAFRASPAAAPSDAAFRAIASLSVADIQARPFGRSGLLRDTGTRVPAENSSAEVVDVAAVEAEAMAQARIAYDAELGAALDHARELIRGLGAQRAIDGDALAAGLRRLVANLVGQVVAAHIDEGFIAARVEEGLATLKSRHEPGRLVLHPEDLALLDLGERFPNLTLVADATLARGSLRLCADGGEWIDGAAERLAQVQAAILGDAA